MQHRNALNKTQPVPLVDTLTQGFAAVNRRAWVLLIPLLLDAFFWFGPRIGITPLLRQLAALNPDARAQLSAALGAEAIAQLSSLNVYVEALRQLQGIPLRPLLATLPVSSAAQAVWDLTSWGTLFGVLLLLNIASLVLAAVYLVPLAHAIQGGARWSIGAVARTIGSFLAIGALVLVAVAVASVMVLLGVGVVALVAQGLANALLILWGIVVAWCVFAVSFAFDAAVLERVGPLRALWHSVQVVWRSLWRALGLWLLSTLIIAGLGIVWQQIAALGPGGVLLAIVGSAYITTGVAAAHLVFYQTRRAARPATT